jgi:hypothetical protein
MHLEIFRQSIEPIFYHHLHFFITTHARAAQKMLQVCEQVKITWNQVPDCRKDIEKNVPGGFFGVFKNKVFVYTMYIFESEKVKTNLAI